MVILMTSPLAVLYLIILLVVIGCALYMLILFLQNNADKKTVSEIQEEKEQQMKEKL